MPGPRLRDHHHDGMRQRAAREHEQFQGIVEHGRIAAVGSNHRQYLFDVVAEKCGFEQGLAGVHPIDISAQRIDFAIMRQVTVGVGAIPTRKGVGAEARVDERKRRLHGGMQKIGIILPELRRQQHSLIDHRLERKTGNVEEIPALNFSRITNHVFGALTDDVKFALKRHVVGKFGISTDKNLPHERLGVSGGCPKRSIVGGDGAPAEDSLTFLGHDAGKSFFAIRPLRGVAREENHSDAVFAGSGQFHAGFFGDELEEIVRRLNENARPITSVGFAATGATMVEIEKDLESLLDNGVRFAALNIDDETDTARLMLELRIVQTFFGRRPRAAHLPVATSEL